MPLAQAEEFSLDHKVGVLVWLAAVALGVLLIFIGDRRWQKSQSRCETVSGIMKDSHAFSLNLVRHFMPSFKVEKYQFRGLQIKAGAATVEFEDLGLELPGGCGGSSGKRVLDGVTGEFKAGRLCAIMGPSGAGKTTFMSVLSGKARHGRVTGSVRVNGEEAGISKLRTVTGFVPQDDIVHPDLTCREQIQFSARLRNNADVRQSKLKLITQDVLNVMQIDHIQNSIVGSVERRGVSGGQRKRVSIGLELAAQPTLLFLDEPTSGLDSTSSLAVVLSLKKMCQLGMTSIMVIHQPRYSVFTLFDDVLLLGKGGRAVYLGPSSGAKRYFEGLGFSMPQDENPADWFMDVLSGEVANAKIEDFEPDQLVSLWQAQSQDKDSIVSHSSPGGQRGLDHENQSLRARDISSSDDRAILAQKLEECWDQVDRNNDGFIDAGEFRELLARCSALQPTADVVDELLNRMAGRGATAVTRKQFLEYLVSLGSTIARDQTLAEFDRQGRLGPHTRNVLPDRSGSTGEADLEAPNPGAIACNVAEMGGSCNSLDPLRGLERDTPGMPHQFRTLLIRRLVQWWRLNTQRAISLAIFAFGGAVLAVLDTFVIDAPRWCTFSLLNLHTALALLLAIYSLQTFGAERLVFWRERASGLNVFADFLSRLLLGSFDILVQTYVICAVWFLIRQPHMPFGVFLVPFLLTAYVASGWGYLVSTVVAPTQGPFIVFLLTFIISGVLGNPSHLELFLQGGVLNVVVSAISMTRWSVPMSFDYYVHHSQPHPMPRQFHWQWGTQLDTQQAVCSQELLGLGCWWACVLALLLMGTALRMASFLGLRFRHVDGQL
uniref:Calmodulin n=1 Tax=Zooxanthella nutricula TaxID=1333877 RepID=A0A6U6G2C4_9DINO|mmetsp:Transcript_100778/g.308115  ORF Transcript_100778/g.308115 Transcript_100778/m.308115 type:complete len:831 (+) Transcript_100778:95-2587(+)